MSVKQSLVLDGEKGELMKASGRVGKRIGVSEGKTMAALKSHSEAERRRRDRINAHLAAFRGLVPSSEKMDKATLLAEVVNQVKQLKKTAAQASKGLHVPMDADELEVEKLEGNPCNRSIFIKASLCCDYRHDLLSDLRQAIAKLPVRLLQCEISTLGSRVKTVFLITADEEWDSNNAEAQEHIVSSVRAVLSNILDKVSASAELAQQLFLPRKRQRLSCVDSLCSSS